MKQLNTGETDQKILSGYALTIIDYKNGDYSAYVSNNLNDVYDVEKAAASRIAKKVLYCQKNKIRRFQRLIQAIPLDEQAFMSKKSTWAKYLNQQYFASEILEKIFSGENEVQISRKDLFDLAKQDNLEYFIIVTILWGYPRGMRGNHFENLVSQMQELVEALQEARNGIDDWSAHYEKIININGLGLSTYSKFLYFLEVKVEGFNALILDNRITDTLNKKLFSEFVHIGKIRYDNAVSKYPNYLRIMDNISKDLNVNSGKVEMFIFEFGQNLKL